MMPRIELIKIMISILLHIYPLFFTTFVHFLSATVALEEQQLDEMKICKQFVKKAKIEMKISTKFLSEKKYE
jgi:hypothetical protein